MEDPAPRGGLTPGLRAAQVCAALNGTGARYLVIGGVACILHGHIRATIDVDILIEPTPENVRRVLEALGTTGYGFAREWDPQEILRRPITVIGDDPAIDLFTVAWTVRYDDAIHRSRRVRVDGVEIPLLSLDDLIASKRTGRLQDAADIEVLEEIRLIEVERSRRSERL